MPDTTNKAKSWMCIGSRAPISLGGAALWTLLSRGLRPPNPPPSPDSGGFSANDRGTRDVLNSSTEPPHPHLEVFGPIHGLADGVTNPGRRFFSQSSAAGRETSAEGVAEVSGSLQSTIMPVVSGFFFFNFRFFRFKCFMKMFFFLYVDSGMIF